MTERAQRIVLASRPVGEPTVDTDAVGKIRWQYLAALRRVDLGGP